MSSEFQALGDVELFTVAACEGEKSEIYQEAKKIRQTVKEISTTQQEANSKALAHFEEIPELESEESFLSDEKEKMEEPRMSSGNTPNPQRLRLELAQKVFVRPQPETLLTIPRNRITDKMSLDPEMGSSMFEEIKSVEKSDPEYDF